MMEFNLVISFPGNCNEACQYYKEIFNGEILQTISYRESGLHVDSENENKIFSCSLKVGECVLTLSDAHQYKKIETGNRLSISLNFNTLKEIQSIYQRFEPQSNIITPLSETSWGSCFAMLKDKYDIQWVLNLKRKQS